MPSLLSLQTKYISSQLVDGIWTVEFQLAPTEERWLYPMRKFALFWSEEEGMPLLMSSNFDYECVLQRMSNFSPKQRDSGIMYLKQGDELIQSDWQIAHIRPYSSISDISHYRINSLDLNKKSEANILDLNYQNIQELSPEIGQFQLAEAVFLNHNNISELPSSFSKLKELKQLDISHNPLKEFPVEIFQLNGLENLSLTNTDLSEIADQLAALSRLRVLHLQHNQLSDLPPSFSQLKALEELDLHDNQFKELPSVIQELNQLKILRLGLINHYGNPIDDIPEWIGSLKNLRELSLAKTNIQQLPESIAQLEQLKILWLPKNFRKGDLIKLKIELPQLTIVQ
jgi:Leucine-rich repeat (LRR) protein